MIVMTSTSVRVAQIVLDVSYRLGKEKFSYCSHILIAGHGLTQFRL